MTHGAATPEQAKLMIMMIAPNSHARKGVKERGEVKGEYGRI